MYKNFDDESLAKTFPAAMALSIRRAIARTGTDASVLDLQRSPGGDEVEMVKVEKMSLSSAYAIDYFVDNLSTLAADRSRLQSLRRRSDRDLFPLFRNALEPAYGMPSYLAAHDELVDAFGIAQHFVAKHRVLVVTGEPLLDRMAGPAIRAWEIAKALAPEHDVWLVSTVGVRREGEGFRASRETGTSLVAATEWADVIIFQGFLLEVAPKLHTNSKILVADIYDPMHLEQLEQGRDLGPERRAMSVRETTRVLNEQIARADFMLCASDKQRDFWLGQLAGQGRVNPAVYDEDHSLASLLAVVPFGIPDEAPVQKRHAIRGAIPGIGPDDKVIIWGGGIYNWFDPLTLLQAVARLSERHDDLRLFFMGLKHPNPGVPRMRVAWQAQELAKELGLTPIGSSSSMRAGSPTTSAPTTFWTRTSACRRTSSTSRPRSASAPGYSTTCGPRCRSWQPRATPSGRSSGSAAWAARSRPRTRLLWSARSRRCSTTATRSRPPVPA